MNLDTLTHLIDAHIGVPTAPVPQSFEVRRHAWRVEAQDRFNRLGLPRGLKVFS